MQMDAWYVVVAYIMLLSIKTISPFFMSLLIVILSSMISYMLLIYTHSWMCYTLLLMFLGGMMVIFIYISSLVFSEKFFLKFKMFYPAVVMVGLLNISVVPLASFTTHSSNLQSKDLGVVFSNWGGMSLIFLTVLMLLVMFMVMKIIQVYKGPLKWKF